VSWGPAGFPQRQRFWTSGIQDFNAAGQALERATDTAERRRLFARMLDVWEDQAPGTILYQPFETYGVKKRVQWRPYSFFFMDLRPDNLRFS
jgi:peptide/nickel transport system substrate-binding protein